jgi:hypothetical protein
MSRAFLLKAAAAAAVVAVLAACDAPTGALGPRSFRATPASRTQIDSLPADLGGGVTTMSADEETCRSGYHIAYREDGTWYCEADPTTTELAPF